MGHMARYSSPKSRENGAITAEKYYVTGKYIHCESRIGSKSDIYICLVVVVAIWLCDCAIGFFGGHM